MNFFKNLLGSFQNTSFNLLQVRNASKTVGGPRNRKRGKGSRFQGIKVAIGSKALQGQILYTQTSFNFLPGLNVEIRPNGRGKWVSLRALKEGTLTYSCERTDLDFSRPDVARHFTYGEGEPLYKKYLHVIPPTQHKRFKLIKSV